MGSRAVALLAVLVGMVSLQSGASLSKHLFPIVGAEGATALRQLFAALFLLPLFRPWRARPSTSQWGAIALYGLSLGAMNFLFYQALARIPLGVAVALEFAGPLGLALVSSRALRDLLWAALAIAGLALLLPLGQVSAGVDRVGALYALAAGACWALYILAGKRVGAHLPGGVATSLGMACALVVTFPLGWAHAGGALFTPSLLPVAAAIGLLSSALPYSLEMMALKRLPAQTFGILMSVEPAVAALCGLVFMAERLMPLQVVAIGLVMLASIGSTASAPALERPAS